MTPTSKQQQFLTAEKTLETPYLLIDLDIVKRQYHRLTEAIPFADCYYAVKCNPSPAIIQQLHALGAGFEAASLTEIGLCLAQGLPAENIHFGNTIKSASAIQKAYQKGVNSFTADARMEIEKIAQHAPGANVTLRLEADGEGATFGLERKFGVCAEDVVELLCQSHTLGLVPYGVSFHTGSQQTDPLAWERGLAQVARVISEAKTLGIEPTVINLGGGFPVSCHPSCPAGLAQPVPDITRIGEVIKDATHHLFPDKMRYMMEPGRYLVAEAGVLHSSVLLTANRGNPQARRPWVFLDVGRFNGLHDAGVVSFPIITSCDDDEEQLTILAGPTCDSDDILYDEADEVHLPVSLCEGDTLLFLGAGAYTTCFSTVGFNGFAPLRQFYV